MGIFENVLHVAALQGERRRSPASAMDASGEASAGLDSLAKGAKALAEARNRCRAARGPKRCADERRARVQTCEEL